MMPMQWGNAGNLKILWNKLQLCITVKILLIDLTKYQRKAENSEIECQAGTYKDKFIIHNSDDVNEAGPPLRTSTLPY